MKSRRSEVIGVILLIVGFVLTVAGIAMLLQRNVFKSVVRVEVYPAPRMPGSPEFYDPYFLLTEFETIQSHPVLTNAMASLNLNERWGKKYNHGQRLSESEVVERIKRHLELRNIRNTKLIEITVFDDDPTEAAQLANAIAQGYCKFKTGEFQDIASEAAKSGTTVKYQAPEIVRPAVPQMRSVSPNRYVAGIMLGCGLFLMIIGAVCLTGREV